MNRTDTPTELVKFQVRAVEETRTGTRRRVTMAAAAATVAAVGVGAFWLGSGSQESPPPADAPPAPSPSGVVEPSDLPDTEEPPQTPGSTVEGFEGIETFPMQFVVPQEFTFPSTDPGTRGYSIDGTSGAAGVFLISTLTQTGTDDLPTDLAAHIRETRDDLVVSDVATTEVDGRPAQEFTLNQKPGTAPYDLWCVRDGSCYKLLEDKPMEVTAVRTGRGLVFFEVEYLPKDRAEVRQSVEKWLASVRWK